MSGRRGNEFGWGAEGSEKEKQTKLIELRIPGCARTTRGSGGGGCVFRE